MCGCLQGCDASVLVDADESHTSEKEASPNLTLRGFEVIDAIKSDLENICPGIVSCSDILAVATKEAVVLVNPLSISLLVYPCYCSFDPLLVMSWNSQAGGPSYRLQTGRKDSLVAFKDIAERELPSPRASLSVILARFASRGFNQQETVSLLGIHHFLCQLFSLCFARSGRIG